MAPAKLRGTLNVLFQLAITIGASHSRCLTSVRFTRLVVTSCLPQNNTLP